jgi:flavorubredoxin
MNNELNMKAIQLKPDIYWVGGIDWNLRNFHGYSTERGSTYNAYLIIDQKITLVDTVKHYLFPEMLERIKSVIDPTKIDYIVSNHVEMDHSGSLPMLQKIAPQAKIITSPNGEKGLQAHFGNGLNLQVVKTGDVLSLGKRSIHFVLAPMVHWPDSMVSYIPEENLLLPNDAFGQHIAASKIFDDENEWGILREEAAKYYANIVLPYGGQVQKLLNDAKNLKIDMIGPSHGVIWRKQIDKIIDCYQKWSSGYTENNAVIVYDTMWGSTEKLAHAIDMKLSENNITTKIFSLTHSHISNVMTEVLEAKYIFIGSPTLNSTVLPTMGAFLTYLKGLKPSNKTGFVFSSYGWGGQAANEIQGLLKDIKWQLPSEPVNIKWLPSTSDLEMIKQKVQEIIKD